MDIDLALLREVESAKEIPFNELVEIVESAILAAYQRNSGEREDGGNEQEGSKGVHEGEGIVFC